MLATVMTVPAMLVEQPGPWHHGGADGPPSGVWWIFPILWGLLWVGVLFGGYRLLRGRMAGRDPRVPAEGLLAERFARGEIGEDEYQERLAVLRK
jgi:putative membrane protein